MNESQESPNLTVADLVKFLETESDFAFELMVHEKVQQYGFKSTHGATYTDPLTNKLREYDIRATKNTDDNLRIHLAIECKNFSTESPLLVHQTKRRKNETGHDTLLWPGSFAVSKNSFSVVNFPSDYSPYNEKGWVGKSIDQIVRDKDKTKGQRKFKKSDSAVFDKTLQAVNSLKALLLELSFTPETDTRPLLMAFVPCLVVPDRTLWTVNYENSGTRGTPITVDRVPYYIGREAKPGEREDAPDYTLSHLEIMTFTGLNRFLKQISSRQPDTYQDFRNSEPYQDFFATDQELQILFSRYFNTTPSAMPPGINFQNAMSQGKV